MMSRLLDMDEAKDAADLDLNEEEAELLELFEERIRRRSGPEARDVEPTAEEQP